LSTIILCYNQNGFTSLFFIQMKHLKKSLTFLSLLFTLTACAQANSEVAPEIPDPAARVDFEGFANLTDELQEYRQPRLIDIETFNQYAQEENTIILDTRSKEAYEEVHMDKAVHLNFSDFTEQKLAKVIPNKDTRILIYCNNNILSEMPALTDKSVSLALNIPTFVNLYGYGYENIYELNEYLSEVDPRLNLIK